MKSDRPKILIVDDEPVNIHVLGRILGSEYRLIFARGGAEALRAVSAQSPDLILLDVLMPGVDGYQVCMRLQDDSETSGIPVIFVTALGDESDEARGFEFGAVDYVTKPLSPPIVRARVRTHLELKRQRDMLKNLALLDGLTGVANRRRFDEALPSEWRRCARNQAPLSLAMVDVDRFKGFNDRYGHLAGDDCLRQVAQALSGALHRPADLIARFGGEEFVLLLPETDAVGATRVAEAARSAAARLGIVHESSPPAGIVTVSLGVATADPVPAGAEAAAVVDLADRLLYQAKGLGRNRAATGSL